MQRVFVSYLPLGRSESSLLQRTVGTGSPWTTQWNSTLSSASTTTLLGRFTKVGRSVGRCSSNTDKGHYVITIVMLVCVTYRAIKRRPHQKSDRFS